MSSMPERDASGQRTGSTQQGALPGDRAGAPSQTGMPGQGQFGSTPPGGYGGQPQGGYEQPQRGTPGDWGSQPGNASPVNLEETRVTGRRVVQYLIDAFLVSLIPSLVSIPFDRSNSTSLHIIGGFVAFVLFVLIGLWYWVVRPHGHTGQTFGMQLLGIRVISKGGGPASMAQLFIRWICLIFDSIPYTWPFTGLVGFIVILCSRNRQRIGDHLARTLVIAAHPGTPSQFATTSEHPMGADNMSGPPGMSQQGMSQQGMSQQGMNQQGMNQGTMGQGSPPGDMR
jgi:uncharacterized RDD family membrane protein YckC